MIYREASESLKRLAKGFPVLTITGPRQSGKTTLAKHHFKDLPYVSLENPDQRDFASDDPVGFLAQYPDGVILDEAQHCPNLFSYLQDVVDQRGASGRFVLTGSGQFTLLEKVTQTLAGRVGMIHLLPFSNDELHLAEPNPTALNDRLFCGMYPPVHDRNLLPDDWYPDYINTYVERDVRQLINVRDLNTFRRFVRMCAARSGQVLNMSDLASDAGVSHNTIKAWLSILEASYLVFFVHPHFQNFSKRLIKSPKLYFYDTGLLCSLLGIRSADQLSIHSNRGALFESWVAAEIKKYFFNRHEASDLYFWRDHKGVEVDFIIEGTKGLVPIEVKSGATINRGFLKNIEYWMSLAGSKADHPTLIYGGDRSYMRSSIQVLAWTDVTDLFTSK